MACGGVERFYNEKLMVCNSNILHYQTSEFQFHISNSLYQMEVSIISTISRKQDNNIPYISGTIFVI